MNTRIGYPNEHLAPGSPEDITSPMYATGVGLLMMGIQSEEKVKTPTTSANTTKKKEEVTGHSDAKKKGSWFSSLLNKTEKFFEDDAIK
jgi:cell division protein FtsA